MKVLWSDTAAEPSNVMEKRRSYFPVPPGSGKAGRLRVENVPAKTPNRVSKASDLQKFFNRTPYLAARALREDAQGTMDVSLNWPLQPLPANFTYTAILGTNSITLAQPETGKHQLVTVGVFETDTPRLGESSVLFLQEKNQPLMPVQLQIVRLVPGRNQVPLIGGCCVGDDGLLLRGEPTIYVPAGFMLIHSYTTTVAGATVELQTLNLIFPETQPLTSLL